MASIIEYISYELCSPQAAEDFYKGVLEKIELLRDCRGRLKNIYMHRSYNFWSVINALHRGSPTYVFSSPSII
ncbi:MAG: hypothetical protein LBH09_03895 [Peptococcaceae bacterium]|nr:hypothetical protein [Peptococcaceae bacterium]